MFGRVRNMCEHEHDTNNVIFINCPQLNYIFMFEFVLNWSARYWWHDMNNDTMRSINIWLVVEHLMKRSFTWYKCDSLTIVHICSVHSSSNEQLTMCEMNTRKRRLLDTTIVLWCVADVQDSHAISNEIIWHLCSIPFLASSTNSMIQFFRVIFHQFQ